MCMAILVDGGFYRRRAQAVKGDKTPPERAEELVSYCKRHLNWHGIKTDLYRIFYYDCPPSEKRIYHPYTKRQIDLKRTDLYEWTTCFFNELKQKRKVALRLGKLAAKQARREGIDFILDPLGAHIKPELVEHIDGLRTCEPDYMKRE